MWPQDWCSNNPRFSCLETFGIGSGEDLLIFLIGTDDNGCWKNMHIYIYMRRHFIIYRRSIRYIPVVDSKLLVNDPRIHTVIVVNIQGLPRRVARQQLASALALKLDNLLSWYIDPADAAGMELYRFLLKNKKLSNPRNLRKSSCSLEEKKIIYTRATSLVYSWNNYYYYL